MGINPDEVGIIIMLIRKEASEMPKHKILVTNPVLSVMEVTTTGPKVPSTTAMDGVIIIRKVTVPKDSEIHITR